MSGVKQVPRFVQRCSLWYFYTEFWSDRDQEVWANIVTDDCGALWLNDDLKPVYKSGTTPRPWVVLDAQQFVKLKVRRGTNRMLLKLDNQGGLDAVARAGARTYRFDGVRTLMSDSPKSPR
jgi:hypothetical protein